MSSLPHVLLPYQCAWQEDPARIRIAEKSRRVGFSWNIASECTLEASEVDGCDTWYVGYNKEMAQEFIRDVAFWARKFSIICEEAEEELFEADSEDKAILTYTIRFASGYRISALSSRPTNLRNKRGHIVIDEAAYHDDLKGLLKAALAVLIWGGRARVDIISTHNGVENHFNTVLEEVKAGKKKNYSLHRVTIDDAIHQGLVERICFVNGDVYTSRSDKDWRTALFADYGDDSTEELLCVPSRSGGTYINTNLIERQMIDGSVYRLELKDDFVTWSETAREAHVAQWCDILLPAIRALPKDKMHFFGEDFGRVSDRTVIAPGFLTQDLKRRFPFAVELLNVPFEQQKQVLFFVADRLPKFFAGALDATGNGAYLAEVAMQRYGATRISCVTLNDTWYATNLPPFKAAFEDELIEVVRDADHRGDLNAFKVINGIPKLPKTKNKSKIKGPARHGDAGIAYLLAHFASKMPKHDYSYQTPKRDPTIKAGFRKRKQGVL